MCIDRANSIRAHHVPWMGSSGQSDLASIIIPTYNRASLLKDTLDSAAAQTYRPLEIVIVDDGSTDNTPDLVAHWQDQFKFGTGLVVRYCHQPNSGVGSARNHGLMESRGEFIQFLDSDDLLHPQKLSLQIQCLRRHPQCGYALSDRKGIDAAAAWDDLSAADETVSDSAQYYCTRQVWLTMVGVYRRQTCREAGPFAEDLHLGEDEEFNLRVLLATPRVVYLDGVLCAVRRHSGPRLTDAHNMGREGLVHFLRMYRRMIESAAAKDRLQDARLVSALAKSLSHNIRCALEAGCGDFAEESIALCSQLPIEPSRRLRLAMFRILNVLPEGALGRLWPLWLKLRKGFSRGG